MGKGFVIDGMEDMKREIAAVSKDLMEAEEPSAMAAGEPIKETWRGLVPVLDGHYRDSLTVAWVPGVGAVVGTRWLPELPREEQPFIYSKTLEFGRDRIPAHPSARPAMAAAREEALAAGREPLESVVKGRKPRRRRKAKVAA